MILYDSTPEWPTQDLSMQSGHPSDRLEASRALSEGPFQQPAAFADVGNFATGTGCTGTAASVTIELK